MTGRHEPPGDLRGRLLEAEREGAAALPLAVQRLGSRDRSPAADRAAQADCLDRERAVDPDAPPTGSGIDLQDSEAVSAACRDVGGDRPELGPSVGANNLYVNERLFARQRSDAGLEPRVRTARPARDLPRRSTPRRGGSPRSGSRLRDRRAHAVRGRVCLVTRVGVATGALTAAGGARAELRRSRRDCQSSQNRSRNQCDVHAHLIGLFRRRSSPERACWNVLQFPRA